MAGLIDVGILRPELAGAFGAGYRSSQQARQQAAEAEQQLAMNRQKLQMDKMTMERLQEDRAAMLQLQDRLKAAGQDPDLNKVFDALIATGNPDYVAKGIDGKRRLKEQDQFALIMGGGVAAPPAAAPNAMAKVVGAAPEQPANQLGSGMFGMAVGPSAPAAPVNQLRPEPAPAGVDRNALINRRNSLIALGTPQAIAAANVIDRDIRERAPAPAAPSEVVKLNRELAEATAAGDAALAANIKARIARLTEKPEGTKVDIKLPPQQGAFEAELGKGQAKKLLDDKVAAEDAASIINTVQQGRELLRSGMITGFGAEALTKIGAALNQAGFRFAEEPIANTQAFSANMAQNVGRVIKQFGAGTGLSNADREYAEKMAGGKVTLDSKAIERILDINERAARNVIAAHNKRASAVKTNIPLTVDIPAAVTAPVNQIPTGPSKAPAETGLWSVVR